VSGYFFAIFGGRKSHHTVHALDFLDLSAIGNYELTSSFEESWPARKQVGNWEPIFRSMLLTQDLMAYDFERRSSTGA